MPKRLTETTPLSEAGTALSKSGRMKVHAITAGLGSSGYYSPAVLEEAATNGLIAKGTPLFLDHPSETDRHDRPERSVKDIAAVFTEAATYDATEEALVGEIQVFAPYRDLLTEMAPYIGLSISGSATDITEGEVDGKRVPVIESLSKIDSVDWVTRAGRGGKVVELLESARVNKRALAHGVEEATVNDTREALGHALSDAYGGKEAGAYVRDFDDSTVWFEVYDNGDSGLYAQAYSSDDGVVELTGEREEVRAVTTYVTVTRPDSNTPTTTESLEDNMAKIQIEESEHRGLTEKAGRVDALESENAALKAEKAALEESRAADQRRSRAMDLIREHEHAFSPLEAKGLVADLPIVAESNDLDEEAFKTQLAEHAAAAEKAKGAGTVSGFGQTTDTSTTTTESAATPAKTAWGRSLSEKGA